MALRWDETTVEWRLRDHPMWTGYDADRPVAQVAEEWRDGAWQGWAAWYWGDLDGRLGASLGHDPRRLPGSWSTAGEAMQAVNERHDRSPAG